MKGKFGWGAVVFTVCFIFIVRFVFLEGPAESFYSDLLSIRSENYSLSSLPPQLKSLEPAPSPPEHISQVLASNLSHSREIIGAWGGLKRMLNRSDLPVEVEESFREGLLAWHGLLRLVDEEDFRTNAEKQCPHSASPTNVTDGMLEFPCGLIVDSSITILGTPVFDSFGFHIDLIGGKGPDESRQPPIILSYNVRMHGDKLTDQAVIIQNIWSPASDWDEEERCPAPVELTPRQVDGLDRCIEQVGRVLTWKPPSGKESATSAGSWPKGIPGSEKTKAWFPFAEGMPFAATIWVGWEGFHVTVNGKHISSFQYRLGHEPWLVGEVQVKGDLNIRSILAAGLPYSEHMAGMSGLEFLKARPLPPKSKKLALFIGVFSSSSNFDQRMAQRRSWMQHESVRSGDVVVRFFVGLHKQEQVNKELWEEANTFGDLQFLPFVDYYTLITLKTAAICIFSSKHVKADYVMKTDDDTFVRVEEVLSLIKHMKRSQTFLLGEITMISSPQRDRTSKWYISEEEWPQEKYPPWAHGPGYIFSVDIAKFVSTISASPQLNLFKLEDVAMGIWVEEFQRSQNKSVDYIHNDKFISGGCADGYVIAHYQTPRQMLCLWNLLQKTGTAICCD